MPDFGIGEALAAFGAFAAESAPEIAAGAEIAGAAAPELLAGGDALAAGLGGDALAGVADTGLDAITGALGGAGGDTLSASTTAFSADSLSPSNWLGFETTDAATGNVIGGGTFGGGTAAPIPGGDALGVGAAQGGGATPGLGDLIPETAKTAETAAGGTGDLASLTGDAAGKAVSGGGSGNIMDSLVGSLSKNPLGAAAGAAGLGMAFMGNKPAPNQGALQGEAGQLAAQGQQMQQYLQTGQLPPGLQANIDQATKAAKARVISNHAAQGQNTNPAQNSALAQELSAIDQAAVGQAGQIAMQLLQSGLKETDMSNQLYQYLTNLDQTQAQNQGKAIANFASALAPKTTINLGNSAAA